MSAALEEFHSIEPEEWWNLKMFCKAVAADNGDTKEPRDPNERTVTWLRITVPKLFGVCAWLRKFFSLFVFFSGARKRNECRLDNQIFTTSLNTSP